MNITFDTISLFTQNMNGKMYDPGRISDAQSTFFL